MKPLPVSVLGANDNYYLILEELVAEHPRRLVIAFDEVDLVRSIGRMHGGTPKKPTFCDLFEDLIGLVGMSIERVTLAGAVREAVARVWIQHHGHSFVKELAPQDAIELVVKTGCPLLVDERTLDAGNSFAQKAYRYVYAKEQGISNEQTKQLLEKLGDNPKES